MFLLFVHSNFEIHLKKISNTIFIKTKISSYKLFLYSRLSVFNGRVFNGKIFQKRFVLQDMASNVITLGFKKSTFYKDNKNWKREEHNNYKLESCAQFRGYRPFVQFEIFNPYDNLYIILFWYIHFESKSSDGFSRNNNESQFIL